MRELAEAAGISFARGFGHEKANRNMNGAFANNRSKTPTSF